MPVEKKKKVLLISPSILIARGLETVFTMSGDDFRIESIISDLSSENDLRLNNGDVDAVIVDPSVFDHVSRMKIRSLVADTQTALVAIRTVLMSEEELRLYDESFSLYDSQVSIIKKLRSAISSLSDEPKSEGEDLSAREKEILICVARGMLNKEIADYFSLSIYTVQSHRKNITRKTGIKSVAGLTVYAILNKLIEPDSIE